MLDVPVASPVYTPVPLMMDTIAGVPLVHVPGAEAFVSVALNPGHNVVGPPMAAGAGLTVSIRVRWQFVVGAV
jgi:hypothetical protein